MWSVIYGSSDPLYQGHPIDKDKQCSLHDATYLSTNKESKHLLPYIRKEHLSASMMKLNAKINRL